MGGAGILPFAVNGNKIYVLLSREYIHADTNGGTWSDFGGGQSKGESFTSTAIREGWEESDGILGSKQKLKRMVKQNTLKILSVPGYKSFLVKVDYDPTLPKKFRKKFLDAKKKNPKIINKNGMKEKDMLKWVETSNLKKFRKHIRPRFLKLYDMLI